MEPHEPFDAPAEFQARFAAGIPPGDVQRLNKWSRMLAPICTGWTGMACREPLSAEEMAQLGALYDAEVAAVDHEIGRLLEGLEQRGILQHALVIVTADHGEEFMEHGSFGHGFNLFNTTVRVPLIVVGPEIPAGRVVRENVSLIDLAPTLLDLLHLAPDPHFEGRSLVPFLHNAAVDGGGRPDIIMQLPRNGAEADMRWHREALVRNNEKLVVSPDGVPTLYDMAADPAEQQPRDAAEARGLVAALETANAALASRQRSTEQKVVIDAATKEKLRALGYHTD
jgi:arylsulfatase A-like enzyme